MNLKKLFRCVSSPIFIILVIGAIVRICGINFGLPHTGARPDESDIVQIALRFGLGDLNPHWFMYPSLYMYVLFVLYAIYYLLGRFFGVFSSSISFMISGVSDPTNLYLIDRFLSAAMGIATIYIVYKLCRYLFNKNVAILASLFLSLSYLHVRDSHFGVTDITMTFFVMCSIYFIVKCLENDSLVNYAVAGIFGGLTTSIKYPGGMVMLPLLMTYFINSVNSFKTREYRKIFINNKLFTIFGVFFASFILGTPYSIFDFKAFIRDVFMMGSKIETGHGTAVIRGWLYHSMFSLPIGMGSLHLLFGLAGMATCLLWNRAELNRAKASILFVFPVAYYLFFGSSHAVFLRYIIPVVPFICIGAAYFVCFLNERYFKHMIFVIIIAIIIMCPSIYRIFQFDSLLLKKDNRLVAAEWVERNIKDGSSIGSTCSEYGDIKYYPRIDKLYELLDATSNDMKRKEIISAINFFRAKNTKRFDLCVYDKNRKVFYIKNKNNIILPKYIITESSPLIQYSITPANIQELIKTRYDLIQSFVVSDVNERSIFYNQQDAFYLPYSGFKNIDRPGPNLFVYERIK